jgi:hypothetical protein
MKPAWWSPRPGDAVKRHGFWVEAVAIWRTLRETAQRDSESCQLLEAGWTPVGGWMPLSMVNFANLGENIGRSRWIWDVKKKSKKCQGNAWFHHGEIGWSWVFDCSLPGFGWNQHPAAVWTMTMVNSKKISGLVAGKAKGTMGFMVVSHPCKTGERMWKGE